MNTVPEMQHFDIPEGVTATRHDLRFAARSKHSGGGNEPLCEGAHVLRRHPNQYITTARVNTLTADETATAAVTSPCATL